MLNKIIWSNWRKYTPTGSVKNDILNGGKNYLPNENSLSITKEMSYTFWYSKLLRRHRTMNGKRAMNQKFKSICIWWEMRWPIFLDISIQKLTYSIGLPSLKYFLDTFIPYTNIRAYYIFFLCIRLTSYADPSPLPLSILFFFLLPLVNFDLIRFMVQFYVKYNTENIIQILDWSHKLCVKLAIFFS